MSQLHVPPLKFQTFRKWTAGWIYENFRMIFCNFSSNHKSFWNIMLKILMRKHLMGPAWVRYQSLHCWSVKFMWPSPAFGGHFYVWGCYQKRGDIFAAGLPNTSLLPTLYPTECSKKIRLVTNVFKTMVIILVIRWLT